MKTITTPWKNELLELISNSNNSIKITSPFVKREVCDEILANKKKETTFELITNFKIRSIYSGSVDLDGLDCIINNYGIVKNYSRLHAKIYLFDDEVAVVTSGNLTNGGLLNNYEYGVLIDDRALISMIVNDYNLLSTNQETGIIKPGHINEVRKLLSKLPKEQTIQLPKYDIDNGEPTDDNSLFEIEEDVFLSTLKGWKLEVFKCVNLIPNTTFRLDEVNEFESILKARYPQNNHIADKIRQQLQNLRDIGLIDFLGNGHYRKLWKIKSK